MSSIKRNIVLNFINVATSLIFPIITFPYAARILTPEGIGIINFYQSIIGYIVLFASLGIPLYGVREVAKYRDDIKYRNKTTVELFLLSIILSLFGYIVIYVLSIYIIHEHSNIFYALSFTIFFTAIGVQWFYQAIEDFKYITIRTVLIRVLSVIGLFVFVHDKSDLLNYAYIIVFATVGNNIINFIYLRKYIFAYFPRWKEINIAKHIKPILYIFALNIITSLYTSLNVIMLGFMGNNEMVGYYSAGNKMSHIVLTAIASMSTVMLPKLSNLYGQGNLTEFNRLTQKCYNTVLAFSLPCIVGILVLAKPITLIFCGADFAPAISVLRWTSPIVSLIALSNLIGIQILYPQGKEKIVIISTMGGAIINILFNIVLIPVFQEDGVAISTCISELIVLLIQIYVGRKYLPLKYYQGNLLTYMAASAIIALILFAENVILTNDFQKIVAGIILGFLSYFFILYVRKDEVVLSIIDFVKRK